MNEKLGSPADLDKPKDMSEDVQEDMKNSKAERGIAKRGTGGYLED